MSNINYISINENFPVAGQDNDTQVFRDNFDTIKTSLRVAKQEIEEIKGTGEITSGSARRDADNDFGLHTVENAVLQRTREQKYEGGIFESESGINWENGPYQIWTVDSNVLMSFDRLPGDVSYTEEATPVGLGRLTLELYNNINYDPEAEADNRHTITFTTANGTVIKSTGFPDYPAGAPVLTVSSADNPIIVEIWRHSAEVIFMRYVGEFA